MKADPEQTGSPELGMSDGLKTEKGSPNPTKPFKPTDLRRIFIRPNLAELAGYYSQQAWIRIRYRLLFRLKVN